MTLKTILLVGTFDTKGPELQFLEQVISDQGAESLTLDVSVLGEPSVPTSISKHEVAVAAGTSIEALIALGDENAAFLAMSRGAATLVASAYASGRIDALLAIGGTMGTDLALDCALALPMGVPKFILSTVSFSQLIGADRFAPDVQMMLWAGGLYGLNPVCRSSLSQAAGAVVGAARAAQLPDRRRPLIGMTSLGSSCLRYMTCLTPALEARGYEVAVFHSTGMGGMAFEKMAADGAFVCVMDFCMQELVNLLAGSVVNSGPDRLSGAGRIGTPQLVAPGALDLLDFAGWQAIPEAYQDRPFHEHNRLIKSSVFTAAERRRWIGEMATRLQAATGPCHVLLPLGGVEEWDKPGGETHDAVGLEAMLDEARRVLPGVVPVTEVDAHINDAAFSEAAMAIFDDWVATGVVPAA